jgi:hypothetical protein
MLPGAATGLAVERGLLVRVLAVAQGLDLVEGQLQRSGKVAGLFFGIEAGQPVGDRRIVARGVGEGLLGQAKRVL